MIKIYLFLAGIVIAIFAVGFVSGYLFVMWQETDYLIEQSKLDKSNQIAEIQSQQFKQIQNAVQEQKTRQKLKYELTELVFSDPNQFPTPEQTEIIKNQIKAVAEEMDYKNSDLLMRLAFCESSYRPGVIGKQGEVGLFQIHLKYHPEISEQCAKLVMCSTKEAIRIIRERGINEWACGRFL